MSLVLRGALILVSVLTFMIIVKRIRNAKVQIEYSLFWIVFAAGLLILAFFPDLAGWAATILGIQSPANFIFLFVIFVLLVHQFFNSIKISQMENKLRELTQELAVRQLREKEEVKENE